VLADVCEANDIGTPSNVASRLASDERGIETINTPGGKQRVTVINEALPYGTVGE
jgi:anti-repressor protein